MALPLLDRIGCLCPKLYQWWWSLRGVSNRSFWNPALVVGSIDILWGTVDWEYLERFDDIDSRCLRIGIVSLLIRGFGYSTETSPLGVNSLSCTTAVLNSNW